MIDVVKIQKLLVSIPMPPEDLPLQGVSDAECNGFERRTGILLPHDVRHWLKLANGPCVGPGGFYGIQPHRSHLDMELFLSLHPSWLTQKWLPIAGDGCGNHYIMPTTSEYGSGYPVLFIDTSLTTDSPAYIVASDIEHFLVSMFEKELGKKEWPFNEESVLQSDPKLKQFKGVDLPWAAHIFGPGRVALK